MRAPPREIDAEGGLLTPGFRRRLHPSLPLRPRQAAAAHLSPPPGFRKARGSSARIELTGREGNAGIHPRYLEALLFGRGLVATRRQPALKRADEAAVRVSPSSPRLRRVNPAPAPQRLKRQHPERNHDETPVRRVRNTGTDIHLECRRSNQVLIRRSWTTQDVEGPCVRARCRADRYRESEYRQRPDGLFRRESPTRRRSARGCGRRPLPGQRNQTSGVSRRISRIAHRRSAMSPGASSTVWAVSTGEGEPFQLQIVRRRPFRPPSVSLHRAERRSPAWTPAPDHKGSAGAL